MLTTICIIGIIYLIVRIVKDIIDVFYDEVDPEDDLI